VTAPDPRAGGARTRGAAAGDNGPDGDAGEIGPTGDALGDVVHAAVAERMTRRRLVLAMAGLVAGLGGAGWVQRQPGGGGVPDPLRAPLDVSARVADRIVGRSGLAPTFDPAHVRSLRVNGLVGLDGTVDNDRWRLRVAVDGAPRAALSLADLRAIPPVEQVTEHKCVEGWSTVVAWRGVRCADVFAGWPDLPRYVRLNTSDGVYSAAMETAVLLHPQTLFATGLNGAPLDDRHGAPVRLVVPVAYGYKSIKRVGSVRFTHDRPTDYWHQRGYDWYATH